MSEVTVKVGKDIIELHPGLFAYFRCTSCDFKCEVVVSWKELFCKICSKKKVCNKKIV
jgi:hypothetical protein